ncbi:MAG: hypothetical protein R3A10_19685 [Caldilineaceae bacterium]
MSTTQSASRMVSSSCSTTSTVLPKSRILERVDEPGVVALVEADARLVQNVEYAHELAADLGGQPNALRLAAGEGGAVRLKVK